jgi:hypothetical protein
LQVRLATTVLSSLSALASLASLACTLMYLAVDVSFQEPQPDTDGALGVH